MTYILDTIGMALDPEKANEKFKEYYQYLESVKEKLPHSAYEYAISSWHYNATDLRCPHDAWLESLDMKEISPDKNDT